jgi:hypothetical protein
MDGIAVRNGVGITTNAKGSEVMVRPKYMYDTHLKWVRHCLAILLNNARVTRHIKLPYFSSGMYTEAYIAGLLDAKHTLEGKYGYEEQTGTEPERF